MSSFVSDFIEMSGLQFQRKLPISDLLQWEDNPNELKRYFPFKYQ